MGEVDITFNLKEITEESYIDLKNGTIMSLYVNNKQVLDIGSHYNDSKLFLNQLLEEPGLNTIHIQYSCDFAKDGFGLIHTVIDELDFFITQMEPDGASYVFPCFDMPGLRNNITIMIVSLNSYEYSSNGKQRQRYIKGDTPQYNYQAKSLFDMMDRELAVVEFEVVYDLPIHLVGIAFGNFIKCGGNITIGQSKMYCRVLFANNLQGTALQKMTDFYLYNATDAIV